MPLYRSWYSFGSSSSLYFFSAWRMVFRKLGLFVHWKRWLSSLTSAPHEQNWVTLQLLIQCNQRPVGRFWRQSLLIHCRFFFACLRYNGQNKSQLMTSKVVELHPIHRLQYRRNAGNSIFLRSVGLRFRVMVQP